MSLLNKWADAELRDDVRRLRDEASRLREQLDKAESKIRVMQAEIDCLASVVARNSKRIEAETAAAAAQIARCTLQPGVE